MKDFNAKMHQIQFRGGSAPDPAGEFTAHPRPPIWIKRGTSKGAEGLGMRENREGAREGRKRERGGKGGKEIGGREGWERGKGREPLRVSSHTPCSKL